MSYFDEVQDFPPDQIYGLIRAYAEDTNPKKVDLSIGIYRDADLKTQTMKTVKKAEERLLAQEETKSYLPIDGDIEFTNGVRNLLFGDTIPADNIYGAQVPGGTGGLRMGAGFLFDAGYKRVAFSAPTWANHRLIFIKAGFEIIPYAYYDEATNGLLFDEMLAQCEDMPEHTVVLLHGCCHNPTGLDLSQEQWRAVSDVCKKRHLIPFFDVAYQGFGQGLQEDAYAVRHFAKEGHEMLVSYSLSKNMSLYGERTGALFFVSPEPSIVERVPSGIKRIIRSTYSTPPIHGSAIAKRVLSDPILRQEWEEELTGMRQRIMEMHVLLATSLEQKTGRDFSYLKGRQGMFSYSGLSEENVEQLKSDYSIYMINSGRVNVCGLNEANIDYVTDAIANVLG